MERPAHRAQPGADHCVRVRAHRGRDPCGQRGGGELVVGQEHQRRGHRAQQPWAGPLAAEPRPEAFRDRPGRICRRGACPAGPDGSGRGQAIHHAGDDAPPGREHGRLIELEPQRVGRCDRRPMTWSRSSGRIPAGSPVCAVRPAAIAAAVARQAGPAAGRAVARVDGSSPVQSNAATSSKVWLTASLVASSPR